MQHILAPGFFFLLLALSQLVQASPTDQDLARILAEAEEAVNSKLTKATVAGAQSRRKLLGRKVTHESLQMQQHNEIVGEFSRRLFKEFKQTGLTEEEMLKKAEEAIRTKEEGNKAREAAVGGAHMIKVAKETIFDVACVGAGTLDCNDYDPNYRTITGVCNNLHHNLWGAASIPMRRLLPPQYTTVAIPFTPIVLKGFPRGSFESALGHCVGGGDGSQCHSTADGLLPNARHVSINFHGDTNVPDPIFTHMVMQFGQFLDHDITLTPEIDEECPCFSSFGIPPPPEGRQFKFPPPPPIPEDAPSDACFPIQLPCDEDHFGGANGGNGGGGSNFPYGTGGSTGECIHFLRSLPFCGMEAENREQVNAITAFVDASNVYGSSPAVQSQLRAPTQGQLKISDFSLLPVLPILDDPATSEHTAGDIRARENPGLAGLHTIFVREHNRIANYYATMTSMSHEMIYQLTRRIVGAQMQNVVYGQFLTAVLGQQAMDDFNLSIDVGSCYNENLDPSIFNSFATAAFRFGHSLIQGLIEMVTLSGNSNSDFKLRDNFFDMTKYVQSDGSGMEEILFALIQQKAQTRDQFATEDVTNFLFANIDAPGSDLIARNIHRGRDHGLPGYNDFREKACNLPISCDWNSPPSNIPPSSWAALKQLYKNPGDIDLFTGGLAEKPIPGSVVGSTFQCLIAEQFVRLKFGDRFFFTHAAHPDISNPFTIDQMNALRERNLGDILCENTAFLQAKKNVFLEGPLDLDCQDKNNLDLDLFL